MAKVLVWKKVIVHANMMVNFMSLEQKFPTSATPGKVTFLSDIQYNKKQASNRSQMICGLPRSVSEMTMTKFWYDLSMNVMQLKLLPVMIIFALIYFLKYSNTYFISQFLIILVPVRAENGNALRTNVQEPASFMGVATTIHLIRGHMGFMETALILLPR